MCEIKTVIIVAALLLAATGYCLYQETLEKKLGHNSHLKTENSCKKEYKKYCLNGGECYYIVDEDIVSCNCTWLHGGKRYEKYMWWT